VVTPYANRHIYYRVPKQPYNFPYFCILFLTVPCTVGVCVIFLQGFFVTCTNEVQKQEYMLFPVTFCNFLTEDIYFNVDLCLLACMSYTHCNNTYYYAHFMNKYNMQSGRFCSDFQC
jgi:hypothetical protein